MERTVLVTGFDPFGGESVNPSWEAVKLLPELIGDIRIERLMLPTVYGRSAELAMEYALRVGADTVVCVGQAGGRAAVTPEVIGINLREASIADNDGNLFAGTPIKEGAPAAHFSTLPVREIVAALKEEGINAALSYSAGAFVCNDLLYTLLDELGPRGIGIGFIHVPYIPEQTEGRDNTPSMPLSMITRALEVAISAL